MMNPFVLAAIVGAVLSLAAVIWSAISTRRKRQNSERQNRAERLPAHISQPGTDSVLTARNNLAYAYRATGRVAEAIPLFEETVTDSEQALGADHPDTLTARKNLAGAYEDVGRLAEAIPLLERTLADRERVQGA